MNDVLTCLTPDVDEGKSVKYNLLASICHEGTSKNGTYKVHIRNKSTNTWFEV